MAYVNNDTGSSLGDFGDDTFGSNSAAFGNTLNPDGLKGVSLGGIPAIPEASSFSIGQLFKDSPLGGMSGTGMLQGIGAIAQVTGSLYDAHQKQKYQDKLFNMEQDRVNRENTKQQKQQNNYDKVFG